MNKLYKYYVLVDSRHDGAELEEFETLEEAENYYFNEPDATKVIKGVIIDEQ